MHERIQAEIDRCNARYAEADDEVDRLYWVWRAELLAEGSPDRVLDLLREEALQALRSGPGARTEPYPTVERGGAALRNWWQTHRRRLARNHINWQRVKLGLEPHTATLVDRDPDWR